MESEEFEWPVVTFLLNQADRLERAAQELAKIDPTPTGNFVRDRLIPPIPADHIEDLEAE